MQLMDNVNLHISFLSVLVAAIAYFFLGAIWYSPKVFGHFYSCHHPEGHDELCKSNPISFIGEFVVDLIMAYVLAIFIHIIGITSWHEALIIAFWIWLGFIATTNFSGFLWSKRRFSNFLVTAGFNLIGLLLMAAIIGLMKNY